MSSDSPRNTTRGDYGGRDEKEIAAAVRRLLKNGSSPDDYNVMQELKNKYKDNRKLVDAIFDAYKDRLAMITKKARKFSQFINTKYPNLAQPAKIRKAKKYASKIPLSDDEMQVFINMILTDSGVLSGYTSFPNTPMAKMLGYRATKLPEDRLNVGASDYDVVNEIIRMKGQTKGLHSQVVLQSLTYRDCAPEALHGSGDWKMHKDNVYSYVHPVVAALFLPRIKILDETMLIANIGNIIESKQKNLPLMTQPDYELYTNFITDPTHSVCNDKSPIRDLLQRYHLQTKLWDSVLNLRQGIYYNEKLTDFLVAVDNCKDNIYDAPDLTYVKDEGTVLRRLLSAFSLRPTLVSTIRLYNMAMGEAQSFHHGQLHSMHANPLSAAGISQISTVPIITLRLPLSVAAGFQTSGPTSLQDSLTQPQWYVENKTIVPKAQHIMHSRGVVFFYVGRRFKTINLTRMSMPCNFQTLPMTVAGFEKLNDHCVNFDTQMQIQNDNYQLRSVVMVEKSRISKNLITGTTAGIVVPADPENGKFEQTFLLYDPQGAGEMFVHNDSFTHNDPITCIPGYSIDQSGNGPESFFQRASTRGTIFVYQKVLDAECDNDTGGFIKF